MTDKELMQQALDALEALELEDMACRYEKDPTPEHITKAITAIREALAQPKQNYLAGVPPMLPQMRDGETIVVTEYAQPEQEPVNKYCCHLCFNQSGQMFLDRMLLCPECGNKRCPKATYHELPCTNSNEPNQPGSIYTTPPHRKPLTDEEIETIWQNTSPYYDHQDFARDIEAAHGIKE